MWDHSLANSFTLKDLARFANRQCVRLREEVRHELIMVGDRFALKEVRSLRFGKSNEFDRNGSALMEQLEETVLSVRAWLPKVYNCCFILQNLPLLVDSFPVAFHIELLDVGGEFGQSLAVRDDGPGSKVLDRSVIESNQSQQQGQIFLYYTKCTSMGYFNS